jgi:hypothetical protein
MCVCVGGGGGQRWRRRRLAGVIAGGGLPWPSAFGLRRSSPPSPSSGLLQCGRQHGDCCLKELSLSQGSWHSGQCPCRQPGSQVQWGKQHGKIRRPCSKQLCSAPPALALLTPVLAVLAPALLAPVLAVARAAVPALALLAPVLAAARAAVLAPALPAPVLAVARAAVLALASFSRPCSQRPVLAAARAAAVPALALLAPVLAAAARGCRSPCTGSSGARASRVWALDLAWAWAGFGRPSSSMSAAFVTVSFARCPSSSSCLRGSIDAA